MYVICCLVQSTLIDSCKIWFVCGQSRFLAEPKWQEERWIRDDTVCLQQYQQFIYLIRSCISTRRELSVCSYNYNVTVISSHRRIRFLRQRIGQSDARRLSPARNFTRYTKEKQNQYENTTRYNRLLIYCSVIARQRKDVFPGQMLEYHPLNKQWD